MRKILSVTLLSFTVHVFAHAQTNAAPQVPAIAVGQDFHCQWADRVNASDPIVCVISHSVLRADKVSTAIGAGSWLNGQYVGENSIEWRAVQTGDAVGSQVFALPPGSLLTKLHGTERPGTELLVTVKSSIYFSEELSPPKALSNVPHDVAERPAFYQALMAMSSSEARYAFLVDQYLSERCGKPQTLSTLKSAVMSSEYPVLRFLKNGDISAAQAALANLQCEH